MICNTINKVDVGISPYLEKMLLAVLGGGSQPWNWPISSGVSEAGIVTHASHHFDVRLELLGPGPLQILGGLLFNDVVNHTLYIAFAHLVVERRL